MPKRRLIVELDEDTIRALATLGLPTEVLANLALTAADGVALPGRPKREQTDQSLRVERGRSDDAISRERAAVEETADAIVRVARQRADEVQEVAREQAEPGTTTTDASCRLARSVLEGERSDADAVLKGEREEQESGRAGILAVERRATDKDLIGERVDADALIAEQREVNEEMLRSTIRAHESEAAGEERERELRMVAELREVFIGVLGHDLRNPLGSIATSAALLLRRGRLDPQDAETAARIIRSSQRISRMLAQVLDLTRARVGGGLVLDKKPTDLGELCRNAIDEFEAVIELVSDGDLTGIWDEDRLAEALSNLIGNATQYAAPGTGVRVDVRADGGSVVVEVTNQGVAIAPDALPFIFEPFRRGGRPEKADPGNLGLGLYISRQIALAHSGTLDVRSAGDTTTFTLRLPRVQGPTGAT